VLVQAAAKWGEARAYLQKKITLKH